MLKKIIAAIFLDSEVKGDILFLKKIDFFRDFTLWQLKKILAIIYKKEYLEGEIIYNKNDEAKLFCILQNGKIELQTDGGKQILTPDNIFGQRSLMCCNELYVNTAKAIDKSKVYIIHKYDLETLMEEDTKIGFKIAKMLLDNLYNNNKAQ